MSSKEGLEAPSVEPRVVVQIPEPGRIDLLIRVPAPARRKGRVEQAIIRRLMDEKVPGVTMESKSRVTENER